MYQKPPSNNLVRSWQNFLKIRAPRIVGGKIASPLGKSRQRGPEQHPEKVHAVTAAREVSDDCSSRGLGRLRGGEGDGDRRQNFKNLRRTI